MTGVLIGPDRIREYLPHRPPFLFVDRVVELEPEKRILAELRLRPEEPHFEGHFPGDPIMPGVLITEALAQTSGLLLAFTAESQGLEARGRLFYLARAEMKWTRPARPGETLFLEATYLKSLDALVAFRVRGFTEAGEVAQGKVTLARVT